MMLRISAFLAAVALNMGVLWLLFWVENRGAVALQRGAAGGVGESIALFQITEPQHGALENIADIADIVEIADIVDIVDIAADIEQSSHSKREQKTPSEALQNPFESVTEGVIESTTERGNASNTAFIALEQEAETLVKKPQKTAQKREQSPRKELNQPPHQPPQKIAHPQRQQSQQPQQPQQKLPAEREAIAHRSPENSVPSARREGASRNASPEAVSTQISSPQSGFQSGIQSELRSGNSGEALLSAVEASLYGYLQACYPESSKRRGEEGIATLSITISEGKLRGVTVLKSTGFPRLDRCAVSAVESAGERALNAGAYHNMAGTFRLRPIRFQLREGR